MSYDGFHVEIFEHLYPLSDFEQYPLDPTLVASMNCSYDFPKNTKYTKITSKSFAKGINVMFTVALWSSTSRLNLIENPIGISMTSCISGIALGPSLRI